MVAHKDNASLGLIEHIRKKLYGKLIKIKVLENNANFDPLAADTMMNEKQKVINTMHFHINAVTTNGDWDAWNNGTFGASADYHLHRTIILSTTEKPKDEKYTCTLCSL